MSRREPGPTACLCPGCGQPNPSVRRLCPLCTQQARATSPLLKLAREVTVLRCARQLALHALYRGEIAAATAALEAAVPPGPQGWLDDLEHHTPPPVLPLHPLDRRNFPPPRAA